MSETTKTQSATALPPRPRNLFPVWLAATLAVLWLIVRDLEISFEALAYGVADMGEYFSRYGRPDFSDLSRYLQLMGVTLATALWGTVFALVVGFFLAPLAARNLAPHPLAYRMAREVLNFMRAMPPWGWGRCPARWLWACIRPVSWASSSPKAWSVSIMASSKRCAPPAQPIRRW